MALMTNESQLSNCEFVSAENLLEGSASSVEGKIAYSPEISLLIGKLPPGYKSRPHVEDSEQISYLTEGSLWVFVEGKGYQMEAGDFIRVPPMAVHWTWNSGERPASFYAFNTLPNVGNAKVRAAAGELLAQHEKIDAAALPSSTWLSDRYVREAESKGLKSENNGLLIRNRDLPDSVHLTSAYTGRLSSKFVYGKRSNLMLAKRAGKYHSPPHLHACDQMNYLIEGELWIFLENEAYHLRPGDFMRVPRMAPHWAFNPSDTECVLIESHSPINDPSNKPYARGMFEANESTAVTVVQNLWLPEQMAERESRLMQAGIHT
jgi:quercetin dioxygenase-like cupin family protein